MRKGLTLVEVLVVVAILGIVAALLIPAIFKGCGATYYGTKTQGVFRCVKTYTIQESRDQTSKRVDLQPVSGGPIQTFRCDDDWGAGIYNSATLYGQFEPNKYYHVESVGYRQEGVWALFPLVTAVSPAPQPIENPLAKPKAEVESEAAFR